jgi:hypothetical protein
MDLVARDKVNYGCGVECREPNDPRRWNISSISFFGPTASTLFMKADVLGSVNNTCLLLCQRRLMLSSTRAISPVATTTLWTIELAQEPRPLILHTHLLGNIVHLFIDGGITDPQGTRRHPTPFTLLLDRFHRGQHIRHNVCDRLGSVHVDEME